jgi:hypothetical protein
VWWWRLKGAEPLLIGRGGGSGYHEEAGGGQRSAGSTRTRALSRCKGSGKVVAGVKAAQWSQGVGDGGDGRWPGVTGTTCARQRTGTLAWSIESNMWLASGPVGIGAHASMANGGCQVGQIKAEGTGRGRGVWPERREEFSSFLFWDFWI